MVLTYLNNQRYEKKQDFSFFSNLSIWCCYDNAVIMY